MEEHVVRPYSLRNDFGPDIEFVGRLVAASSGGEHELQLFITKGGITVMVREDVKADGLSYAHKVDTCEQRDTRALTNFFGYGPLAKELFTNAGVPMTTHID